jgi:ribose-phosphate pyrophosphokinase
MEQGAQSVYACATHAVLSGRAPEILAESVFTEVVVTNTIPVPPVKHFPQLKILSVANVIGEAIWRVHEDSSVSSMFR